MNFPFCITLFVTFQTCIPASGAFSTQFRPKVISVCTGDGFNVTLETSEPFFGIIHPVNNTECRVFGVGKNETKYQIPFSSGDVCGLQYNPATNTYSVRIEVNKNYFLSLDTDRTFDLSCKAPQQSHQNISPLHPMVFTNNSDSENLKQQSSIGFYDGDRRVTEVIYGNPYRLQLTSAKINITGEQYRVTDCIVSNRMNTSLKLVDAIGCLTSCGLINEFKYFNGMAEAIVPSMFRFPDSLGLEIRCTIAHLSNGFSKCPISCNGTHDNLLDETIYGSNETDFVDEVLNIRRINRSLPNKIDTVNCSVDVITANRLLVANNSNVNVPEVSCIPVEDISKLRNYTIILCAAFLTGCIINLCCCCLCLIKQRNVKCNCRDEIAARAKKKVDESHLGCDFWIKEKTLSPDLVDEYNSGDWNRPLPRTLSTKSYATVRQKLPHPHPNINHLPLSLPDGVIESPSLKSTDSSQTSTFGIRPTIHTSYTVDTDLNSIHSSVSVEKNAGYFIKTAEVPPPQFNLQNSCLTNITSSGKEAYSIL
uniref:ZP domain-containing protein n=1 Tax=Syphacia muris TaxID=451379 RepID=A0A0N5AMH9_9BILA